jgi:hypothetical protein
MSDLHDAVLLSPFQSACPAQIVHKIFTNEKREIFWAKKIVDIIDARILYQIYDIRNIFLQIIRNRDRKLRGYALRTITNMYLTYLEASTSQMCRSSRNLILVCIYERCSCLYLVT